MASKAPFKRICLECQRHFAAERPDARYCSSACRRAHFQSRPVRSGPARPGAPPKTHRPRRP